MNCSNQSVTSNVFDTSTEKTPQDLADVVNKVVYSASPLSHSNVQNSTTLNASSDRNGGKKLNFTTELNNNSITASSDSNLISVRSSENCSSSDSGNGSNANDQ
jgi:hypothetical protein